MNRIDTVVSEDLPVGERLLIRRKVVGRGNGPRICITTGIHGDELEGQYVCYELARRLSEAEENIHGTVEIWPAINPLGVDSVSRGIPTFDLDMNRIFPGNPQGHMVENVAYQVIEALRGADMVIDIHASNLFLYEVPQARISNITAERLVPYSKFLNLDFVWVHEAATVLESTIAHSLNSIGTPTLVVEMGIGMRITRKYGDRLVAGIFNLLSHLGAWKGERPTDIVDPIISTEGEVVMINAAASGVIVSQVPHGTDVKKGDILASIVSPLTGETLDEVRAPESGFLITMRGYPVVYEGSLIARIFTRKNS